MVSEIRTRVCLANTIINELKAFYGDKTIFYSTINPWAKSKHVIDQPIQFIQNLVKYTIKINKVYGFLEKDLRLTSSWLAKKVVILGLFLRF